MSKNSVFANFDDEYFSNEAGLDNSFELKLAPSNNNTEIANVLSQEFLECTESEIAKDQEHDKETPPNKFNADSSLVPYFKNINRFKLLTDKEEKNIAIRIKESEETLTNLITKLDRFWKKDFIKNISAGHEREILQSIIKNNRSLEIFDELVSLAKERKKIKGPHKGLTHTTQLQNDLDNRLSSIENAISKKIGQVKFSEEKVKDVLSSARQLSNGFRNSAKRKKVEWELAHKLREISWTLQEIRRLKNELVKGNLRLVITIAKKYLHHGIPLSDLIQEGNLGLIRAIDTYDYRRGNKFVTYAVWWIRQAVLRMIDCHSRTIRIPVYLREKMNKIDKVSSRLFSAGTKDPSFEEIATAIDTLPGEVEKIKHSFKDTQPIDELTENNQDMLLNSSETFQTSSPFEQTLYLDLQLKLDKLLSMLSRREREVVKLRFGVGKKRDHTLDEIGKKMGLSRERIRQILEKVLREMKTPEYMSELKDYIQVN